MIMPHTRINKLPSVFSENAADVKCLFCNCNHMARIAVFPSCSPTAVNMRDTEIGIVNMRDVCLHSFGMLQRDFVYKQNLVEHVWYFVAFWTLLCPASQLTHGGRLGRCAQFFYPHTYLLCLFNLPTLLMLTGLSYSLHVGAPFVSLPQDHSRERSSR